MDAKYHIARYSAIALFALLGVQGLWGSYHQWADSNTIAKVIQTTALSGYGIVGSAAAISLLRKRPIHYIIQLLWAVCIIVAAGIAPIAWADTPIFTGVISALGGTVIAAAVLWLVRLSRFAP